MTPLSHTMHTPPAATEQVGDTVESPIASLPDEVLVANIFPYLGSWSRDLSHAGQVCRRFRDASRLIWQQRAQEIGRNCAELLPPFGISPIGASAQWAEAAAFLDRTVRRIKAINDFLPEGLQSRCSAHDLVCKVGPGHMQEFLQTAYDHSLRILFGELAHVPEDASLEETVRLIKDWLQTAEAEGIQELRLASRGLCCLPKEIGQLTALQELELEGNQLASLPTEIGRLTALQRLGLRDNQLTSLPLEIGQLTALQTLYLDDNQLASLPPEIGRLTALHTMSLYSNHLTFLPPEIGRLTALQWLYLGGNHLTSLPPELGRLTALQWLGLGFNKLTSLPSELGQLTALHSLDLSSNKLTSLPPELGQLTSLQRLYLDSSQLSSLPPELERLTPHR